MERSTVTRGSVSSTVSGSSSSSSMFQKNQCILRDKDASFSSYLRRPDDLHHQHAHHLQAAVDDSSTTDHDDQEISIFDAQKYFNELSIINDDAQKVSGDQCERVYAASRFSWAAGSSISVDEDHDYDRNSIVGRNNYPRPRARSFHVVATAAAATPTASSEASWNSQTGLLSNPHPGRAGASTNHIAFLTSLRRQSPNIINPPPPPHHNHEQKKNRKLSGWTWSSTTQSSPRWFGFAKRSRRCPCSGKKSVQVVDLQETKISSISSSPLGSQVRLAEINNSATSSVNVTAANLNCSLVAPHNGDDDHRVWGREPRRHIWECQLSANMPLPSPSPPQPTSTSTTSASAAGHGGFTFPILKLNGNGGGGGGGPTLSASAISTMKKPSNSSDDHHRDDEFISTKFTFPSSPKSRISFNNKDNFIDDGGSDASSDLFEIESISTSTTQTQTAQTSNATMYQNYYRTRRDSFSLDEEDAISCSRPRLSAISSSRVGLYGTRPSLDEPTTKATRPSSAADPYLYEPSEASIDWSVTTAEGFDHDHDHHAPDDIAELENRMMRSKRRPSASNNINISLLSCRREKAVSVGPSPHPVKVKMPPPPAHRGGGVGPRILSSTSVSFSTGGRQAAVYACGR